jgi:hypothetical protein
MESIWIQMLSIYRVATSRLLQGNKNICCQLLYWTERDSGANDTRVRAGLGRLSTKIVPCTRKASSCPRAQDDQQDHAQDAPRLKFPNAAKGSIPIMNLIFLQPATLDEVVELASYYEIPEELQFTPVSWASSFRENLIINALNVAYTN